MGSHITGPRMTQGNGSVGVLVFLAKHGGHWLANDVSATENDDFGALWLDVAAAEQLHHARWRAGRETAGIAEQQFPDIDRMKTIHVLFREDRRINARR